MQTNYAISIIIPVYNVEPYLPRCLDSIINQTYKNIEIIIVDDGSTDNSGKICDAYAAKDPRIKVIHQENQGPGAARNNGIKTATGDWITCIDSDDYIANNCIEKIVSIQQQNSNIDMILWGINGFIEQNNTIKILSIPYFNKNIKPGKNFISKKLKLKIPVGPCDKLYRSEIIKKYNLQFPVNIIHEDNVFYWHYISYCKSLYYLKDKLYFYRQERLGSITHETFADLNKHTKDSLIGSKIIYDFWKKNNLWKENKALFPRIFSGMLKKSAKRTPASQKKELANKAKNIVRQIDISFIGKLRMYYAIFHYCR